MARFGHADTEGLIAAADTLVCRAWGSWCIALYLKAFQVSKVKENLRAQVIRIESDFTNHKCDPAWIPAPLKEQIAAAKRLSAKPN